MRINQLNSGNGAGGFFQHILERLGADVSNSINIEPDSNFPKGVPNPEDPKMVAQTIETCQRVNADIGIMVS
jgi:phosphomannomutase